MLNLNCKKRGYFKDFLLGGYFLIALFIAAITVTALYSAYEFDLFGKILAKENFVYFICGSFGLIFLLILAYVYFNAAKKSVTLADSISCAMIIVAILYAVYIVLKGYNDVLSIAVPSAIFVLGLVAFIISVIKYDKNSACVVKSDYTFKGPFGYVKAVFSKFSAMGVALVASLIAICFYLCINDGVRTIFLNLAEEFFAVYVISAAALILFVIFLIGGLFNKKINHADLALVSIFFALIISLLQVAIVLNFKTKQLITLAVAFGAWLVLFIIRSCTARENAKFIQKENAGYFKNLFSAYSPLFILSVATLVSSTSILIYKFDLPVIFIDFFKGLFYSDIIVILFMFIALADIFTVGLGLLYSISTLGGKKINVGDFIISTSLITGIVTLPLIFIEGFVVKNVAIGIIAFASLSLVLFVIRLIAFKVKNKKVN